MNTLNYWRKIMFKYSITAYVEDKTGYYLGSEKVTPITVYAKSERGRG